MQFINTAKPLDARFVIGSFGESVGYDASAFKLAASTSPGEPAPTVDVPRHHKLPEIHHIFNPGPKSPPIVVTVVFTLLTVLVSFSLLIGLVSNSTSKLSIQSFILSLIIDLNSGPYLVRI